MCRQLPTTRQSFLPMRLQADLQQCKKKHKRHIFWWDCRGVDSMQAWTVTQSPGELACSWRSAVSEGVSVFRQCACHRSADSATSSLEVIDLQPGSPISSNKNGPYMTLNDPQLQYVLPRLYHASDDITWYYYLVGASISRHGLRQGIPGAEVAPLGKAHRHQVHEPV